MMRRLWLSFAQTVTVFLGIVFVVATLKPHWLGSHDVAVPAGTAPGRVPVSYAQAVQRAGPSVVSVYTRKDIRLSAPPSDGRPAPGRPGRGVPHAHDGTELTSLGSGVIVREGGFILTNHHVIKAAEVIEVTVADGRQAGARLVGADPDSDLAVLQVELDGLVPIMFSRRGFVAVGDVVLAIGNPFGMGQTTTMGIVSALGRNRPGAHVHDNFIQTDASINPGNSGGALVDADGYLLGINTALYSEDGSSLGIGFAIPAHAAELILEQILEHGRVLRGWLGVEPQDVTADLASAFGLDGQQGAIIARVMKDSPAAQAGLDVGDIVLSLEGQPVTDAVHLLGRITAMEPGTRVVLRVLRQGVIKEVALDLGSRPPHGGP